jgi:ParB family chromosome partitioning protein
MANKPRKPSPMMGSVSEMVQDLPSTFLSEATSSQFAHTLELEVAAIDSDMEQARKVFSGEDIEALAKTMASEGQLQPILVKRNPELRGRWTIVAGERRWRAAKHLGWPRILAAEYVGDAELASLLENLQRVDLNLIEEARGLRRLLDLRDWTQAQAAEALGKRLSDLNGALGVLDLPDEFLDGVLNSEIVISRNALIELARVPPGEGRNRLLGLARAGKLTIPMIRAARVEADRPPPVAGAGDGGTDEAGPATPAPLSLKVVGNLRAAIRESREARRLLGNAEREELELLAEEIAELLKLSDRAFS